MEIWMTVGSQSRLSILYMISAHICVGSGLNGTINGDFSAGWLRGYFSSPSLAEGHQKK
jgi:hypothetical protein